jgi:hypothetical protein
MYFSTAASLDRLTKNAADTACHSISAWARFSLVTKGAKVREFASRPRLRAHLDAMTAGQLDGRGLVLAV